MNLKDSSKIPCRTGNNSLAFLFFYNGYVTLLYPTVFCYAINLLVLTPSLRHNGFPNTKVSPGKSVRTQGSCTEGRRPVFGDFTMESVQEKLSNFGFFLISRYSEILLELE